MKFFRPRCCSAFFLGLVTVVPLVSARATSPAPPAETAEMDLASYIAELDCISGEVAGLARQPEAIAPLRASLPKAWIVRQQDQRYEVSTGWLDSALDTMQTNSVVRASLEKDILSRLRVLKENAEALKSASADAGRDDARARLDGILSRREFRAVREPSWWDRARDKFWAGVSNFVRKLFRRLGMGRRASDVLVWCMIAAAFVLLVLWLRRSLLRASSTAALELHDALPPGKTWRHWAQQALRAASQSDYRAAVHAAYWAGVYRLEELGAWKLDRARTPREYMRLLAAGNEAADALHAPADRAAQAEALAALTRSLEFTWYGFAPVTAADFQAAVSRLEALGCRFPSNLATANF